MTRRTASVFGESPSTPSCGFGKYPPGIKNPLPPPLPLPKKEEEEEELMDDGPPVKELGELERDEEELVVADPKLFPPKNDELEGEEFEDEIKNPGLELRNCCCCC